MVKKLAAAGAAEDDRTDTDTDVKASSTDPKSTTPTTTVGRFKFEAATASPPVDYPDEVTAPVTPKAIVSDLVEWTGWGVVPTDLPGTPLPDLIGGLWVAARKLHYRLANSDPSATYIQTGQDSDTGTITGSIIGTDADGDILTYGVVSAPQHGTVNVTPDGSYTYTPDPGYAHVGGTDSFAVEVSDDSAANPWHLHGLTDLLGFDEPTRVIVIASIAPVNHAPTGTATVTNVDKTTGTVTVTVITDDSDSDPVTTTAATEPKYGTLVTNPDGTWTYTPDYTAAHAVYTDPEKSPTEDGVAFTVRDSYGANSTVSVTVPIVALNQTITNSTPTITLSTNQKGEVSAELGVADPDSDPLTHTVTTQPIWGSVELAADGSFLYLASDKAQHEAAYSEVAGKTLDDTFTITTTDGFGDTTTTTVSVTIAPANQAPVVTRSAVSAAIYITSAVPSPALAGKVGATDPDGDPLTYAISTQGSHGTATIDSLGNYTYTGSDAIGDSFTITVSDGLGGQTTQTVKVTKVINASIDDAPWTVVNLDAGQSVTISSGSTSKLVRGRSSFYVVNNGSSVSVTRSVLDGNTVLSDGVTVTVPVVDGVTYTVKRDEFGLYGLYGGDTLVIALETISK